jgi:hypothetical protein
MVLKDRCRFVSQERACFLEYGLRIGKASEAQLFLGSRLGDAKQTIGSDRANFECFYSSRVWYTDSDIDAQGLPTRVYGHDTQRTAIRAVLVGWCSMMLRIRSFGPTPTHPTVGCTLVVRITVQLAISLPPTLPGPRMGIYSSSV